MYNCTGNPHPGDIERVVQSMMADEFGTAFNRVSFCTPRFCADKSDHFFEDGKGAGVAGSDSGSIRFPANRRTAETEQDIFARSPGIHRVRMIRLCEIAHNLTADIDYLWAGRRRCN